MFQPLFREERIEVLHEMMRAHPLATLISSMSGQLAADHLPLVVHSELSEKGTLHGHIHKGNPLWRNRNDVDEVMVIFQGPHSYVTPSWYPSKKEHGKAVPTWDYVVVHARGELDFFDDIDWLRAHLIQLTNQHEAQRGEPWALTDAPKDYISRLLNGIIGFELTIKTLEGTWKVSQNRDDRDREGVRKGLLAENTENAVAISDLIKGVK